MYIELSGLTMRYKAALQVRAAELDKIHLFKLKSSQASSIEVWQKKSIFDIFRAAWQAEKVQVSYKASEPVMKQLGRVKNSLAYYIAVWLDIYQLDLLQSTLAGQ